MKKLPEGKILWKKLGKMKTDNKEKLSSKDEYKSYLIKSFL